MVLDTHLILKKMFLSVCVCVCVCTCSLCVGSVWVNSHSVTDPSLPQCGRRDSGNCTDGGKEVKGPLIGYLLSPACVKAEFTKAFAVHRHCDPQKV